MSEESAEKARYLAIVQTKFGAETQAYYRGQLCCFGSTVTDIGRCETWRGAALKALQAHVTKGLQDRIEGDAYMLLLDLESEA